MAAFSWHITFLMASLALLVTSSGAVPIASPNDIVYLDEHHQAAPEQFRPPALPSFLPLEGDVVGRPLPHYPPAHATTIDEQNFIDTQLHPMIQVYATMQRLEEQARLRRLLKLQHRSAQEDIENKLA